jgi:hypothetical protein
MGHTFGNLGRLRQPIGAVALVAIGFFAARLANKVGAAPPSPPSDIYSTVRSVQPDATGGVTIAYDETRRQLKRGPLNDPEIRRLLLAASHEDNEAVRVESVDVLKNQPSNVEVRDALLNAVAHDSNPGVRLKALEGLKPLSADPEVRRVLGRVLRADDNPAVRTSAIDVLTMHRDDAMVGLIQALVQSENNNSVRLKMEKVLRDLNASIGTF